MPFNVTCISAFYIVFWTLGLCDSSINLRFYTKDNAIKGLRKNKFYKREKIKLVKEKPT